MVLYCTLLLTCQNDQEREKIMDSMRKKTNLKRILDQVGFELSVITMVMHSLKGHDGVHFKFSFFNMNYHSVLCKSAGIKKRANSWHYFAVCEHEPG